MYIFIIEFLGLPRLLSPGFVAVCLVHAMSVNVNDVNPNSR